jgi:tetratricopeptide (TPR) repeat protein
MIDSVLNDRYRLGEELGRGGMGTVYRAHDTVLDRDVAVKLLSQSGLGTEGRERMLREAQAIAKLNHPNIVQVFDAGQLEGSTFIVMELVEGQSLHDSPPKDFPGIVTVARQICAALEHAHSHGIIHRDLKPENVLLAPDGAAKLMDFGLARSVASRLTSEGKITGTVFYLAPELALGQEFDGRADLYSLGVMLYELTTGELPFSTGDPLTLISQHIHASAVPPRSRNAEIPPLLEQLVMQLLSKNPADRPASAAAVGRILESASLLDPAAETDRELSLIARIVRGKFIGRAAELKQANALWTQAAAGQGNTLLISGETGIGKTRFLREFATQVEVSGGLALIGEAFEQGGAPYAPFGQVLRRGLRRATQEGLGLPKLVLADLLALVPELQPHYPDTPPNPPLKPEAEQLRQFESVIAFCDLLSQRAPLLLAIDDTHWADSGSLGLLRHLARRTRRLRLLLAASYREVELDEARPLHEALLDLDRNRLARRVKLAPFTREETQALLRAIFEEEIPPELLDEIYSQTEGNPFFTEEVCKALVETGKLYFESGRWHSPSVDELEIPQSVRLAIQSRVSALPQATQEVLRLAAVLGRKFQYETLAAASELDEESLIEALESAQRAQLIEEVNGGSDVSFSFVHALIPSTLADGVRTLRRRRLHRRAADAIRKIRPQNYEKIAYHYEEAGQEALSLEYYVKAGERAAKAYANPEAERHFQAALDLVEDERERARLLGELALVLSRQGRFQLAIEKWLEGIELYRALADQEAMAGYYARCVRAAWDAGDPRRGLSIAREAVKALEGAPASPGLADLLHETGRAHYFNGLVPEAEPFLVRALEMARLTNALAVQVEALITLGTAEFRPLEASVHLLEEAIQLARSHSLPDQEARALNNLSLREMHYLGDLSRTRERMLRAQELARSTGSVGMELFYSAGACAYSLFQGDLNWAIERLTPLLETQRKLASAVTSGLILQNVYGVFLRQSGQLDQALEHNRHVHAAARQAGESNTIYLTATEFAEAALEKDVALDEALGMVEESRRIVQVGGPVWPLSLLVRLHAAQGNLAKAETIFQQAKDEAGEPPFGLSPVWLGLAEAQLARARGLWPEASDAYRRCAEAAGKAGMRWHRAWTLQDWAEALIAESGGTLTEEACRLLREARDAFGACGAPVYVERIGDRLAELGRHPSVQ